ncbi:MAG: hypothetical protein [Microviridae sp.]|nr:MAG: hypothetical protein [Microviridae sp.]
MTSSKKEGKVFKELPPSKPRVCNPFNLAAFKKSPRKYTLPTMTIGGQVVPIKKLVKQMDAGVEFPKRNPIFEDQLDSLGIDPRTLDIVDLNTMIEQNRQTLNRLGEQSRIAAKEKADRDREEAQAKYKESIKKELEQEQAALKSS